jgi:uncharacterized protein YjbI with pentapeptide repeats
MGVGYIAYLLITGGSFGRNNFSDQDLRDQGDRFHNADLYDSTFERANISGLDMTGAQMHESEMRDVIAEGTDLFHAVLRRSDLRNANFRNARLQEADFSFADLTGADMRGADIRGAIFHGTILDRADLRDARTGPSCDYRSRIPDFCLTPDDGCCEMDWLQAHIDQTIVCRNPFAEILFEAGNSDEGIGPIGVPILIEQETVDGGETYCTFELHIR